MRILPFRRIADTRSLGILTAIALSGCAAPLVPLPYRGDATIQSGRTIGLTVETGEMYGRHPNLYFDVEDQYTVARHLERELERLGIARNSGAEEPDWMFRLVFVRTRHIYDFNEYVLDVELHFGAGDDTERRRYHIRSAEGDSMLTKMFTDASDGKQKAADKLLQKLIPDIEAWIRTQPLHTAALHCQ